MDLMKLQIQLSWWTWWNYRYNQIQTILIASNKSADYKNVRDGNGKMKIFRSTNEWKDGNGNQVKWEGSSLEPAECQHGIKKQ